ncbi:MAG: ABC transporter substrate-binding protein [Clostridia bacterium]|nr:ABC transporter substrate-binding protein [Clostridia bacterium]
MKKSFVKTISLMVMICFLLTACSTSQNAETIGRNPSASPTAQGNTKPLVIYNMDYCPLISDAVLELKELHPETKIEEKVFQDYKEFEKEIATGIMSDTGSDIIAAPTFLLGSLEKNMASGAFIDLEPYFEKATDIDLKDYQKTIMDWGVREGKRYIVPISYGIPTFYTFQSTMTMNNVQFNKENWTWERLSQEIVRFYSSYGESKLFFTNQLSLDLIALSSGIKLVDYQKKEVYFDTPEFKKMLEYGKDIYPCVTNFTDKYNMRENYKDNELKMFTDGNVVAYEDDQLLNPINLMNMNSYSMSKINEAPQYFLLPTLDGSNKTTAVPYYVAAIPSNCSNKDIAFDFIKILLSENMQRSQDRFGLPVHMPTFTKTLKELSSAAYENPLSKEVSEMASNAVDNIAYCMLTDYSLFEIISKPFLKYVTGEISVDECAKEIQQSAEAYLKE